MCVRFLLLAISTMVLQTSCGRETEPTQPLDQYDSMLFIRQGGGDKEFNVYPTASADTFKVIISRLDFRDTTITMYISRNSTDSVTLDTLIRTLNGQNQLKGDFTQPALPTGTWVYIYMIRGDKRTEITNTELRNMLSDFERIVENALNLFSLK